MAHYKPGLISGLISGAVWAALISAVGVTTVEFSYSQLYDFYNKQLPTNSSLLGCNTATRCINSLIESSTLITVIFGLVFGALIGLVFVLVSPRFLGNRSYMLKGAVVSLFFWLLYELVSGSVVILQLITSLAISLFAGYLLGFLYLRFTGPPNLTQQDTDLSTSGQPPRRGRPPPRN